MSFQQGLVIGGAIVFVLIVIYARRHIDFGRLG